MSSALESNLEKKVRKWVKSQGGLCLKLNANLYRGIPDRLILLPGGGVYFVELKRKGKSPSAPQLEFQRVLRGMDLPCGVFDDLDEFKQWISLWTRNTPTTSQR